MGRGASGRYEVTTTAGEAVRAFVPHPLPPEPPLDLTGTRQRLLEQALLACGRLDGVSALLPDPDLFLYGYVRREAVLSSQIEGTQSSLSDLLLFELDEAPGAPFDDVVEMETIHRHHDRRAFRQQPCELFRHGRLAGRRRAGDGNQDALAARQPLEDGGRYACDFRHFLLACDRHRFVRRRQSRGPRHSRDIRALR